jgi:transcriptional regulator with XRE-family HTH domain
MSDTILLDNPQTIELLQAMRTLMRWFSTMPRQTRQKFVLALLECSDEIQKVVVQMIGVVEDRHTTPLERQRALMTLADALSLNPDDDGEYGQDLVASETNAAAAYPSLRHEVQKMDAQEADFADRLRKLMTDKCVTQQELAERVGCSQPAVSQMLNRKCRPQKKTILKLAEALQVLPKDLWPDLEVAEMLDAVADFQRNDYIMTEAEAKALQDTTHRNGPKIPVRSLPTRQR